MLSATPCPVKGRESIHKNYHAHEVHIVFYQSLPYPRPVYSLIPAPCSLLPAPCSLLPAPYSLLPTP
ncbi:MULTISPECIES: hypothetical protein [unclassified Moorena]|uniref:hypothetical protein n=1 Tax=unclassified Moorena TaxID=2683338 RepID=UPI0013C7C80D|nr:MULTISPECIES: hypothetical protein [unclassified Moorena]NEO19868.1 hypothetical protein [Moorena sp. SIO4A5]NEP22747.1 hypothetical protein [Moorena sp. SIO3I6]NEQ57065.1 hypothetical protein [Moorena sp. SIO4A1]